MWNGGKKKSPCLSTSNNFRKVELLSSSAYTKSIVKRIEEEHLNFFFFCKLSNLIESQKQGARATLVEGMHRERRIRDIGEVFRRRRAGGA